jgi:hypothetical protein
LSIATERESPVLLRQAHLGEHATKLFYFGGKLLEPSLFNQANSRCASTMSRMRQERTAPS